MISKVLRVKIDYPWGGGIVLLMIKTACNDRIFQSFPLSITKSELAVFQSLGVQCMSSAVIFPIPMTSSG